MRNETAHKPHRIKSSAADLLAKNHRLFAHSHEHETHFKEPRSGKRISNISRRVGQVQYYVEGDAQEHESHVHAEYCRWLFARKYHPNSSLITHDQEHRPFLNRTSKYAFMHSHKEPVNVYHEPKSGGKLFQNISRSGIIIPYRQRDAVI